MHNKPEGFELPACGLAVVDHRGCKPPIALCGLPWTQAGWSTRAWDHPELPQLLGTAVGQAPCHRRSNNSIRSTARSNTAGGNVASV